MKRIAIAASAVALVLAVVPARASAQARPGKTIAPATPAAPARADTTRRPKAPRSAPPSLVPLNQPSAVGAPANPPANAPANTQAAGAQGAGARQGAATQASGGANPPSAIVTNQSQPAPATPAAAAFTAGLSVPVFAGSASAALDYARTFGTMLDSTIVTLVGVFRNTSGQPISGATGPDVLSSREKDRWSRCRNLYWDLTSYKVGLEAALPSYSGTPALAHAASELDAALSVALDDSAATVNCDNVSSMIAAPGRWTPWQDQYEAHARHFYGGWYEQVLNVHDKDRAFMVALNAALPAARRAPVPPALQRNPPYAGATVR